MPKRICVIDDDTEVRETIVLMLTGAGYEVTEARDGKVGVMEIERTPHSGVVVDLIMPGQEGMETISVLTERFPTLKIIAISGGGTVSARNYLLTAEGLGAHAILAKPFRAVALLSILNDLLGGPA